MDTTSQGKPTKYYIDFENVHGPGLKGVDELDERDVVYIFYSQAAETFHIEHAIDIMKSKAVIEFVEIDGGTRNSLDFQLVAALFGCMTDDYEYAIVSGDGGFDAAIKMGKRLELPEVRRITDLTGSTEPLQVKGRQPRSRSRSGQKKTSAAAKQEQSSASAGAGDAAEQQAASAEVEAAQAAPATQGDQAEKAEKVEKAAQPKQSKSGKQGPKGKQAGKPANDKPADDKPAVDEKAAQEPQAAQVEAASVSGDVAADEPSQQAGADHEPAKSGRYSRRKEVRSLLADAGVKLDQQQLGAVMNALNGVKNKQDFYKRIIQSEKRDRGLELYRKVRDHYESMVDILRA